MYEAIISNIQVGGQTHARKRSDILVRKSADGGDDWCSNHPAGIERAKLNAPIWHRNQLIVVTMVAGIPNRNNLRKILLAITFLASSALPCPQSRRGFIEQTYPDITKKIPTERYPPSKTSRPNGSWNR